jgi:hypothetical protein
MGVSAHALEDKNTKAVSSLEILVKVIGVF